MARVLRMGMYANVWPNGPCVANGPCMANGPCTAHGQVSPMGSKPPSGTTPTRLSYFARSNTPYSLNPNGESIVTEWALHHTQFAFHLPLSHNA